MVPFDDQRVSIVTEAARNQDWPMHLWVNFSDIPQDKMAEWMQSFKQYLNDNEDVTFLLMHVGTLAHEEISKLVSNHPNLYFLLSRTTPDFENLETRYTMILNNDGSLKPDWKNLFINHPDRFLVAFYSFGIDWGDSYPLIVYNWRNILGELPKNAAHALARGNAERIYNIKSGKEQNLSLDAIPSEEMPDSKL